MKGIVYLLFLCSSFLYAQSDDEMIRSSSRSFHPISFEALPYWTNDTTTVDLIIFYRVHSGFFFFAKSSTGQQEIYEAHGELVFELFDENDVAIARNYRPFRVVRNSPPEKADPNSDEVQGAITLKVHKGIYKIVLEAKDSESGKSYIDRDTKIDTRTLSSGVTISPGIFVEPPLSETSLDNQKDFFPLNRGGSVVIGQRSGCLVQVASPDTATDIHLTWNVKSKNDGDENYPQEFLGEQCFQQFGSLLVRENPKSTSLSLGPPMKRSRIVYIPIPTERLETGTYQMTLTITQGPLKSTKNISFNIIWPLKPHSLSDFKLAVDALRHIATEEELDSMKVFSSSKSMNAFRAFWKKRSPDTTRAFNPAMAEYYRRTDESIKRFSSENESDGYRTDRGRIFILYGSPSITNRLLKPNSAPTEIWTYEKLKQRFTFTDQRKTGNYILMKMENY
jgi:GWxTD domain-containing protein